jgi:hypothetical protein
MEEKRLMNPQGKGLDRDDRYWDRNIETIARNELRRIQEYRLKEQLTYVYKHSPFYRDKFNRYQFHPKDFKSMDDIQRIPITHKDELREAISKSGNPLCLKGYNSRVRLLKGDYGKADIRCLYSRGYRPTSGMLCQVSLSDRPLTK